MALENAFDNFITRAVTSVVSEVDRWVEGFDPLRFSKTYRRVLERRHNSVKILGMAKPMPISSIYIEMWAHRDIPSRLYREAADVARRLLDFDDDVEFSTRLTTNRFLKESRHALILGRPGSGKTTLLKHFTVKLLSTNPPFQALPLFVPLREYSDSLHNQVIDYVVADCDKSCGFQRETAEPFFRRLLANGAAAVMLDGLDEVEVEKRPPVVSAIERLMAEYPSARIIVLCRTADYQGWFRSVEEVEIAEFTKRQASDFIKRWFRGSRARAESLLAVYDANRNIRELCTTPLLAALICILYQYNIQLPANRAELYSECIDALLYKWDASRLIARRSAFAELSTARKKAILAEVGLSLMKDQAVVIERPRLVRVFDSVLGRYGIEDGERVLNEISSQHALMLERSAGIWSFMHLTFQEYFAALAVVQNRSELSLISEHFEDPRWREVFLMVASLSPDPITYIASLRQAVLRSRAYSAAKAFLPRLLRMATGTIGLKEAKDIIDADVAVLTTEVSVANKIKQIKAVREVSEFLGVRDLLPEEYLREFKRRFGKPVRPWDPEDIARLGAFGDGAAEKFWHDVVSELVARVRVFGDACRQSGMGQQLIHGEAVTLIDAFVEDSTSARREGTRD